MPLQSTPSQESLELPSIFIDGGLNHGHYPFKHPSNFSLGDGDSRGPKAPPLDIKLPENKDISDTGHAINHLPSGVQYLQLFGFLDGRRDHQLCLYSLLLNWCAKKDGRQWSMEGQVLGFSSGEHTLVLSGTFSLLTLTFCRLKITGQCRYPLTEETEISPLSDLCLSNIGHGEVTIWHSTPILLFRGQKP